MEMLAVMGVAAPYLLYYLVTEDGGKMCKFAKHIITAILLTSAAPTFAQLQVGERMYSQRNGYWDSFLLVFPTAAYTRATTTAIDGAAFILTLDFVPPGCKPTMNFLLPVGGPAEKDNTRYDVTVSTRTDDGARVSFVAVSTVTMGDTYGLIEVQSNTNLLGQIGEMSRGQTLRVKTVFGGDESSASYNSYSLMGMTAAYRRAETMCKNPASIRR